MIGAGEDIYIVGSGASLYGFDFSKLDGKITIACNHSFYFINDPTYILYLDLMFLRELSDDEKIKLDNFKKRVWHPFSHSEKPLYNTFRFTRNHTNRFGEVWMIGQGKSVGLAAISFALSLNPKKIYLLGIDSCVLSEKEMQVCCDKNEIEYPGQLVHFSDRLINHRFNIVKDESKILFDSKASPFSYYRGYSDVITNLSVYSKIDTFPKIPHWDFFP